MNLIYAVVAFVLALVFALVGITRAGSWLIERRNPPVGAFIDIDGTSIHYVHVPASKNAELPPLVFVHGASANLKDQMLPLRPLLEGRAEMLFFDRPGDGWSGRGPGTNETLTDEAKTLAALMDRLGVKRAILVGHSLGGAVVASFASSYPKKTAGLVFLSAATHPWPGSGTSWYYSLTTVPVVGRLFSETLAYPGGLLQMTDATECVFAPNKVPEGYVANASIPLVLRPAAFRANATDVKGLYEHVLRAAPRYKEIKAPTVIISGDQDTVVYEELHSGGLARDIPGAELVWVHNMGHKPDWVAPDLVVAAVEKVAGMPRDLQAMAKVVEARIAGDKYGEGRCAPTEAPPQASVGQ